MTAAAHAGPAGLAARIDAALPQTQCTRCGYPCCSDYASAIAAGEAEINRCPPGGAEGIVRLSAITGRAPLPLDEEHGHEGPRAMAVIDEAWCIGCTLCIKACPVDCIVGAPKRMHTVAEGWCTGCELCVPVCPVDCISMEPVTGDRTGWDAWSAAQADEARSRFAFHRWRVERDAADEAERMAERARGRLQAIAGHGGDIADGATRAAQQAAKQSIVDAALARARAARTAAAAADDDAG